MIIKRSSNFNFEANFLENTHLENWSSVEILASLILKSYTFSQGERKAI